MGGCTATDLRLVLRRPARCVPVDNQVAVGMEVQLQVPAVPVGGGLDLRHGRRGYRRVVAAELLPQGGHQVGHPRLGGGSRSSQPVSSWTKASITPSTMLRVARSGAPVSRGAERGSMGPVIRLDAANSAQLGDRHDSAAGDLSSEAASRKHSPGHRARPEPRPGHGARPHGPDQRRFAEMGLSLTYGDHVDERDDFDSSSIQSRVDDLHAAFADPAVYGILTVIGGFNSNELLPYLDWDLIGGNAKLFCGYSDITALQNAILARTGLVTYSGPHWSTFGMRDHFEDTWRWFRQACLSDEPFDITPAAAWTDDLWFADQDQRRLETSEGWWMVNAGQASGRLVGGNLCTLNLLQAPRTGRLWTGRSWPWRTTSSPTRSLRPRPHLSAATAGRRRHPRPDRRTLPAGQRRDRDFWSRSWPARRSSSDCPCWRTSTSATPARWPRCRSAVRSRSSPPASHASAYSNTDRSPGDSPVLNGFLVCRRVTANAAADAAGGSGRVQRGELALRARCARGSFPHCSRATRSSARASSIRPSRVSSSPRTVGSRCDADSSRRSPERVDLGQRRPPGPRPSRRRPRG